jgi:hypothetical protein
LKQRAASLLLIFLPHKQQGFSRDPCLKTPPEASEGNGSFISFHQKSGGQEETTTINGTFTHE